MYYFSRVTKANVTSFCSRLLTSLLFTACLLSTLNAAPPVSDSMVIEEDWVMRVRDVSTVKTCPQWVTEFSLNSGKYFVNTFNFHDQPTFQSGGIQLQVWDESQDDLDPVATTEVLLDTIRFDNDVIRWTQVIKTNGKDCELKVTGCNSQSWGQNINTTAVKLVDSNFPNLNSYSPSHSVTSSHVMYGDNRVLWFGIVEIRAYNDKGKVVIRDTALRPVVDNTVVQ